MAEDREKDREKDKEKDAAAEGDAGKKGKLKLILIVVAAVLVLGGGGVGAYFMLTGGKEEAGATAPKGEKKAKAGEVATAINLSLDPFLVNLADAGGTHYLRTSISLEMSDQLAEEWVNGNLPQVRDRMLMSLSSRESAELLSAQGKFRLRDELLAELNKIIGSGEVKAVYLTEFVVQ